MKIYFAGPLFTPYERTFIDQCAKRMRDAGMQVFVPHEIALPDPVTTKFIFETDAREVLGANVLLALLDGPMVDDGTANEIGIFGQRCNMTRVKGNDRIGDRYPSYTR